MGSYGPPYRLELTDGTTVIDLIRGTIHVNSWRPSSPAYKGGGTFQDSPLADSRRLVDRRFDNIIDTFTMKLSARTVDGGIYAIQEIRRLLEAAADYWVSDYRATPIYLVAQGVKESNVRYARVIQGRIPQDEYPYGNPFLQVDCTSVWDSFELVIEHELWSSHVPGSGENIELAGYNTFDDRLYGNVVVTSSAQFPVVRGADDATVNKTANTIDLSGDNLIVRVSSDRLIVGVRFDNVTIPPGAQIISAKITFVAAASSAASVSCTINGQDSSNSPPFTTFGEFISRTKTLASVGWTIPTASVGISYDTPSLVDIVQEIIDETAWATGRSMTFFFDSPTGTPMGQRDFASFDNVTYTEPVLTVTYLIANPTTGTVYVANKHNIANISDVYHVDDTGTWSANLVGGTLPFNLYPGTPQVDDALYIGIDTTLTNSGPFASSVLDVGTAQVDLTVVWEYYTGAGWSTIGARDNTSALGNTGVNSIHWIPPSNWAAVNLNTLLGGSAPSVTGYWIRGRLSVVGGAPVVPTQQNRDIYTIVWPFVEVEADQVGGDVPARIEMSITNQSADNSIGGSPELYALRVIAGLRSVSRGEGFTPYLNASDGQNPAGVTVVLGTDTSFVDRITAPSGRAAYVNFSGSTAAFVYRIVYDLSNSIAPDFSGTYRAYIRVYQSGGASGDIKIRAETTVGGQDRNIMVSNFVVPTADEEQELLDLGVITLVPSWTGQSFSAEINIGVATASSTPDLYIYDLVLIPTDEWVMDFQGKLSSGTHAILSEGEKLSIDSLNAKDSPYSRIKDTATNEIKGASVLFTNGPAQLTNNKKQRLWFLIYNDVKNSIAVCHSVSIVRQNRYLSMRGAR